MTSSVSAGGLTAYLEARRLEIDRALESALPAPPDCPPVIGEAMRYSLFAGGKRLRPILTLATADAVSERLPHDPTPDTLNDLIMSTACAIEMIHTYSLVHDDLPAMDDDGLRRGRPTSHVVFGEGIAILAGDGLLTEAFRLLARAAHGRPDLAVRSLEALARIGRAAGAEGMVGGQAIDLRAIGQSQPTAGMPETGSPDALDATGLAEMHARKTGTLIRASAVAGAIVSGAPDALVESVDTFAAELGLAFQIVDDILDVEGSVEQIGKTAGKDAAAGKPTYPSLYGLDESRRLAGDGITRAKAALASANLGGQLPALADWVISRTS